MEVVKEELIPFPEAKRILENKAKDKELGYEQNNALEYLRKFSKLSGKKAEEMLEELSKLEKLKERHRILIVNYVPETPEEVRTLFANEMVTLTEDERKSVASTVKKHI